MAWLYVRGMKTDEQEFWWTIQKPCCCQHPM